MRRASTSLQVVGVTACLLLACQRKHEDAAETASAAAAELTKRLPPNMVLRPVFETSQGEVNAGTAFLVRWNDGRYLMLTAHHLFGPAGGLARELTARELPDVVKSVRARSADDDTVYVESRKLLSIADAQSFTEDDLSRDLAAFIVDAPGKAVVLPIAPGPPREGDLVYLVAELNGKRERVFPAKVVGVTPTRFAFAIADSSADLRGASGAAVLNSRGQVVGICVAGGLIRGELHAYANPIDGIRAAIGRALRARQD
jgi:hypothetical protein